MLSTPEPQRCIVRPKSAQMARSAQLPPSYPASAQLPSHSSPGSPATQGTPASSSFFSDDTLHSSPDPAYSPQGSDHKPPKPPGKIMRLLKRAGSSRGNLVAPEPHVSPFTNLFQELSVEASRPGSAGLKGVPPRTPSRGNSRQPSRRTSESGDNPEGLASAALGMLGGLLRRVSSSGGAAPTASGLLRRLSSGGRNKVHMEPLPLEPAIPLASSSEHIGPEEDATPTKLGDRVTAAGHSQVRDPAAGFRGASPNRPPSDGTNHALDPSLEARETKLSRKHPHPRVPLVDRHGGIAMVDIATSPRSAAYGRSATMLLKFPSASVSQGRAPRARLQVFGSRTYHRSDSLVPLKRYNHECVMVVCCSLPRFWRGYVGTWHINPHTPGPAHKIIHGLRSFKWRGVAAVRRAAVCSVQAPCLPVPNHCLSTQHLVHTHRACACRLAVAAADSSREVLDQVCVYDAEKPPAKQRDLDQLYQAGTGGEGPGAGGQGPKQQRPGDGGPGAGGRGAWGLGGCGPSRWRLTGHQATGWFSSATAGSAGAAAHLPCPYFMYSSQPASQPAPPAGPPAWSAGCARPLCWRQANTFYDHSNPQQDQQEVVVAADDATLHLLAVDADACAQAPFALPAVAWGPGTDPAKREQLPGNVLSHAGAPGAWGLELFLWDGEYRWSASVSYDRDTGDLVRVVAVQEAYTDIKPSTCNVLSLASAKVHEPRDCLEPDASEWLPAGCPGRVCGVSVDSSSGKMNSWSSSDPVSWSPPSTSSHPANCVIILPDAMYLFVPLSLSMMGDDKQGCRIEFGGAMHPGASHAPHTPPPSQYQNRLHKVALEEIEEKQAVARQLAAAKPRFQRLIIDYDLRSGMVSDIKESNSLCTY
ncbi:hypothetical protein QJQ45_015146 [Haematococcus lacustris]|nr:hypothetical protein QJQ45_015146 [Haematococcus lacustris]